MPPKLANLNFHKYGPLVLISGQYWRGLSRHGWPCPSHLGLVVALPWSCLGPPFPDPWPSLCCHARPESRKHSESAHGAKLHPLPYITLTINIHFWQLRGLLAVFLLFILWYLEHRKLHIKLMETHCLICLFLRWLKPIAHWPSPGISSVTKCPDTAVWGSDNEEPHTLMLAAYFI